MNGKVVPREINGYKNIMKMKELFPFDDDDDDDDDDDCVCVSLSLSVFPPPLHLIQLGKKEITDNSGKRKNFVLQMVSIFHGC